MTKHWLSNPFVVYLSIFHLKKAFLKRARLSFPSPFSFPLELEVVFSLTVKNGSNYTSGFHVVSVSTATYGCIKLIPLMDRTYSLWLCSLSVFYYLFICCLHRVIIYSRPNLQAWNNAWGWRCHWADINLASFGLRPKALSLELVQRFRESTGEPRNAAAAVASRGLSWLVLLNLHIYSISLSGSTQTRTAAKL